METLYFYTKLTKKKEKGKRVVRATEFGTWRAQKDAKVYDHSDEDDEERRDGFNQKEQRHIGSKRTFTFVAKKDFSPMLDGPCTSIDSMESVGANAIIMEITHKEKLNSTSEYY